MGIPTMLGRTNYWASTTPTTRRAVPRGEMHPVDLLDRANSLVAAAARADRQGLRDVANDLRAHADHLRALAVATRPGFDCDECLIRCDTTDDAEARCLADVHDALNDHSRDITRRAHW